MKSQTPKNTGLDNQLALEYSFLEGLQRVFPNCQLHNPMLVARMKLRFQEVRKDNQDMFLAMARGFLAKYLAKELPKTVRLDEMDVKVLAVPNGSHELWCSSKDFRMVLRCRYNGGRKAYFYCNYRVRGKEAVQHKILLSAPKPKAPEAPRENPQEAPIQMPSNTTTSSELQLGA